jgi:hypothetical protein
MSDEKERREKRQEALQDLLSLRSPPRTSPGQGGGVTPVDALALSPRLQQVMDLLIRQDTCTAIQAALSLHTDLDQAQMLLRNLVARGYARLVDVDGEERFELIWGRHRRPRLSSGLWDALQQDRHDL